MSGPWAQSPAIVVLTGSGLSREAGFAPFDPAGMPPGLALEDIVTKEGFARDPRRVNDFYNRRRREALRARPNDAHEALAALGMASARPVLIVTHNIDDLHERAGSKAVLHTHGELLKARCTICTHVCERRDDITEASQCPVCGNAGHLRPHVAWVGEEPLHTAAIFEAFAHCRLFLAIGVPPQGEPAASFLAASRRAGARSIAFAGEAAGFDECRPGPLAETVPAYVKRLIADC